jgi:hypothetical protein
MRTGEQAKAVRALERAGARVAVSTLDVVDAGEAGQLLALAGRAAPVAAVFHLAMYLDDRLLASQARARRRCWVGRVTLDYEGLPPVAAHLGDRLLASHARARR